MQLPGGGEVFTGKLASRTLDAMGARAMTMDKTVIVDEGFDPNKPADQALYAHEMYHVQHSGGQGSNEARDAEEIGARAVERMVLHRAVGGAESHEASHTGAPAGAPTGGAPGAVHGDRMEQAERNPSAENGYRILRANGQSHVAIIDRLAREALQALQSGHDQRNERWADKKGFG